MGFLEALTPRGRRKPAPPQFGKSALALPLHELREAEPSPRQHVAAPTPGSMSRMTKLATMLTPRGRRQKRTEADSPATSGGAAGGIIQAYRVRVENGLSVLDDASVAAEL